MNKVLSLKDIMLLCKRHNGKTQELIDILVNALYTESELSYGVCFGSTQQMESFWHRLVDDVRYLPGRSIINRNVIKSENGVSVRGFTIDRSRTQHCGLSFDDIFFDNPRDAFRDDLMLEFLSRIKHD